MRAMAQVNASALVPVEGETFGHDELHHFIRNGYLDFLVVTLSLGFLLFYHASLARAVKKHPHLTSVGMSLRLKQAWVRRIMKGNNGKNIIAAHTLRNTLIECFLMATSYLLIACGVGLFLSSSVGIKDLKINLSPAMYGATGITVVLIKFFSVLTAFFSAFLCVMWSVACYNQVNVLIDIPMMPDVDLRDTEGVTDEYVTDLVSRAFYLQTIAGRISYVGFILVAWLFGPLVMLLPLILIVMVQYNLDYLAIPGYLSPKRSGVLPAFIPPKQQGTLPAFMPAKQQGTLPVVMPPKQPEKSEMTKPIIDCNFKIERRSPMSSNAVHNINIDSSCDFSREFTEFAVAFDSASSDRSQTFEHLRRPPTITCQKQLMQPACTVTSPSATKN